MPRIDAETKAQALQMIADDGVQKTHEVTGISINTLYKWQREAKKDQSEASAIQNQQQILELLAEQESLSEQLEQAQKEITRLSQALADANAKRAEESAQYKKRIKSLKRIVTASIENI